METSFYASSVRLLDHGYLQVACISALYQSIHPYYNVLQTTIHKYNFIFSEYAYNFTWVLLRYKVHGTVWCTNVQIPFKGDLNSRKSVESAVLPSAGDNKSRAPYMALPKCADRSLSFELQYQSCCGSRIFGTQSMQALVLCV